MLLVFDSMPATDATLINGPLFSLSQQTYFCHSEATITMFRCQLGMFRKENTGE